MTSHPRSSSIDLDSPDRPFDNIINFRDVGRSINRLMGKQTEHQMATAKLHAEIGDDSPTPAYNDHLFQLSGVRRHLISLTGKAFERSLLWRLDWWNFLKVLALAASGYRSDAVIIVGEQVMSPRGLIGLGQDTLDSSIVEMKEIFELFASGSSVGGEKDVKDATYPVLVHCTQGKDRTGLVVLMLLLLTGVVSDEALIADYIRSELELVVEVEDRMKEIRKLGLSEDYTKCPDGFATEIKRYLESRYGGVEEYLKYVGVGEEKLQMIREVLVA
ncbi:hypothetical protein BBP40_003680 [Aspergillus hancockii]|nr:hypothetical protein BBP40_003680 [Aspergillus hancockii]